MAARVAVARAEIGEAKSKGQSAGAVFINQHEQGSFGAFLDQWLAGYGMPAHISYDAEAPLSTIAANRASYNVAWPKLDFAAAKVIVSFGADYLDGWGMSVTQQLDFADARAKLDGGPKVVYIGARRSLTGLNSDTWIPARPGTEKGIADALLAAATGKGTGGLKAAADAAGVSADSLQSLVTLLQSAKPSLLLASGTGEDATALGTAVNDLNKALGNVGVTVRPADASLAYEGIASHAAVRDAAERMAAGKVPIAFVRGANPAYSAPGAVQFAEAFAKVPFKVSFSSYPDETTHLCDLVLPDNHSLESWGDAEPAKGTLGLQQPVMDPVFDTRATGRPADRGGQGRSVDGCEVSGRLSRVDHGPRRRSGRDHEGTADGNDERFEPRSRGAEGGLPQRVRAPRPAITSFTYIHPPRSVTAAAPTNRGSRNSPIPSRRSRGRRSSSSTRRPR